MRTSYSHLPRYESPNRGRMSGHESRRRLRQKSSSASRSPRYESLSNRPRRSGSPARSLISGSCHRHVGPRRSPRRASHNRQQHEQQTRAKSRSVSADNDDFLKRLAMLKSVAIVRKSPEPTMPPGDDGRYRLDSETSHALDSELQSIMDVVWQDIPAPETNAENYGEGQARENIKNALGLIVTKRLLNIHNPLYVQLDFTSKPSPRALERLAAWLNVHSSEFQRSDTNQLVVRLYSVHDLDRVMRTRLMKCGKLKVKLSALYDFTKIPDKIDTNYKLMVSNETNDDNEKLTDECAKKVADNVKSMFRQVCKDQTTGINASTKNHECASKYDVSKEGKTSNNTVTRTVKQKHSVVKKDVNAPPQKATQNFAVPIPQSASDTKEKVSEKPFAGPQTKPAGSAAQSTKQQQVSKPVPIKATPDNISTEKIASLKTTEKSISNNTTQNVKPAQGKVSSAKTKPKQNLTAQKQTTKLEKPRNTKVQDDYDELDDNDILALLSQGIVVDECGSDDM